MAKQASGSTDEIDRDDIKKEFDKAVNMTPAELENWLGTEESRSVGWIHDGESEAVGHQSGKRIVVIKHKKKADLTDDDFGHMRKVVGYVHRHMAQGGPEKDKADSRWRYSLMNWGHDPMKTSGS
jgi:hypothetical protein